MNRAWRTMRKVASWLVLAALAGFIAFCLFWRIDGGRWERVESPSMGTRAPVGALLWVKPVDVSTLQVGDFITFYPPESSNITYSHAVYAINDDGTIATKGVIPAPDPWALTADDIVGKVQMTWFGAGWIVQAAPILVIGGLLVGAAWSITRPPWKTPLAMVGGALVVTFAIVVHRPLLNAEQLSAQQVSPTEATVTYVGTGVLPVEIIAPGGDSIVLNAGEVGAVTMNTDDDLARQDLSLNLALSWWWWIVVVLVFLLPGLRSLVTKDPATGENTDESTDDDADGETTGENTAAAADSVADSVAAGNHIDGDCVRPTRVSLDDLLSK